MFNLLIQEMKKSPGISLQKQYIDILHTKDPNPFRSDTEAMPQWYLKSAANRGELISWEE